MDFLGGLRLELGLSLGKTRRIPVGLRPAAIMPQNIFQKKEKLRKLWGWQSTPNHPESPYRGYYTGPETGTDFFYANNDVLSLLHKTCFGMLLRALIDEQDYI